MKIKELKQEDWASRIGIKASSYLFSNKKESPLWRDNLKKGAILLASLCSAVAMLSPAPSQAQSIFSFFSKPAQTETQTHYDFDLFKLAFNYSHKLTPKQKRTIASKLGVSTKEVDDYQKEAVELLSQGGLLTNSQQFYALTAMMGVKRSIQDSDSIVWKSILPSNELELIDFLSPQEMPSFDSPFSNDAKAYYLYDEFKKKFLQAAPSITESLRVILSASLPSTGEIKLDPNNDLLSQLETYYKITSDQSEFLIFLVKKTEIVERYHHRELIEREEQESRKISHLMHLNKEHEATEAANDFLADKRTHVQSEERIKSLLKSATYLEKAFKKQAESYKSILDIIANTQEDDITLDEIESSVHEILYSTFIGANGESGKNNESEILIEKALNFLLDRAREIAQKESQPQYSEQMRSS